MARVKHHAIERLVINYLKNLTGRKLRTERPFMDKAIKMIASKLDSPCCDGNPTFTYTTAKKSTFIFTLKSLLLKVDANKWVESLTRARDLLERVYNQECCFFSIQGFGGDTEGDMCIGETATFFISDEEIAIGTAIYQDQQLTPVAFDFFRDDTTGIIYLVVNGVVTGIAEPACSQIFQITNVDVTPGVFISDVTVDDEALVFLSGTQFPIAIDEFAQYQTTNFSPGLRTVKVTISGASGTATFVDVSDSNGALHQLPFIGAGVYTFENVYVSGPNMITGGVGVSLS